MRDGEFERVRIPLDDDPDEAEEPLAIEPDFGAAVSPRQLATGFAILAALVLLVVGARRRGRTGHSDGDAEA